MRSQPRFVAGTTRRGFTLVELLVVIIIIALLAGLVTAGLAAAMRRARRARITLEISQLSVALQKYKDQYGEFPPDFSVPLNMQVHTTSPVTYRLHVVLRHVRKAFPRYTGNLNGIVNSQGNGVGRLDPAEALVFWLGGLPDAQGVPSGFCKVPGQPFLRPDQNTSRTLPLFEFAETRLADRDNDGWPEYYPPGFAPGQEPPYVYFAAWPAFYNDPHSQHRYHLAARYPRGSGTPPGGVARPYAQGTPSNWRWVEPRGFQIICAGLDRHFGTGSGPKLFPSGANYSPEDWDNLTSFYEGTLEDASQDSTLNP